MADGQRREKKARALSRFYEVHLRYGEGVRFDAAENAQIVEAKLCALLGKTPGELDAEDSDRLYTVLVLAETEAALQREKFLEAIARMFGS